MGEKVKTLEQIEEEASLARETIDVFSSQGYSVEPRVGQVSVAWRIHTEAEYDVLELVFYKTTSVEEAGRDRRLLSKVSGVLLHQLAGGQFPIPGLEFRDVFGVRVPYHGGRRVVIVPTRFLVGRSRHEGEVEVVPVSELSSVLRGRRDSVLRRAERVFNPGKGEVMEGAYTRGRNGLLITLLLICALVPFIFFDVSGTVLQLFVFVDSALILATLAGSLVVYEYGVSRFKRMLREEVAASLKMLDLAKETQTLHAEQSAPRLLNAATVVETVKPTERQVNTGDDDVRRFYAQRFESLWGMVQKTYAEGKWDECAEYLNGAAVCILKATYTRLTGKPAIGDPIEIAEHVSRSTGVDLAEFQRFYEKTSKPSGLTEQELVQLTQYVHKLEADIQRVAATINKGNTAKGVVKPRKAAATEPREDTPTRTVRRPAESSNEEKPRRPEREEFGAGTGELGEGSSLADVTSCDSLLSVMCAEGDILEELRRLVESGGVDGAPVFLVVTQSPEVVRVVEAVAERYPEAVIGTLERAVNGKAQIIVSRRGEVDIRVDYESPEQLERLIKEHSVGSRLSVGGTISIDEFIEFLEE